MIAPSPTYRSESSAQIDRRNFLGGSDIAAVLGVSPWKTPYQLFMEKTGQYAEEITPKRQAIFDRGHRLEPYIMQWAQEDFGLEIAAHNQRYFHSDYPFLSCEIDFEWRDDDGQVQPADVKTTGEFMRKQWGELGTDEIPIYYATQFLFGQALTGKDLTLCVAMIGIDDLRPYRVRRDEALVQHIVNSAVEFWGRIEANDPPPISTLEDAAIAWPKDRGAQVPASLEIEEIAARLKQLKAESKANEDECKKLTLALQQYMGDASEIIGTDGKKLATWRFQERKGYTVAPTSFRAFRLA